MTYAFTGKLHASIKAMTKWFTERNPYCTVCFGRRMATVCQPSVAVWYMFTHPGQNFCSWVGNLTRRRMEFQQSLDWHVLQYDFHKGIQQLVSIWMHCIKTNLHCTKNNFPVKDLNGSYNDSENSVLSFIRRGNEEKIRLSWYAIWLLCRGKITALAFPSRNL